MANTRSADYTPPPNQHFGADESGGGGNDYDFNFEYDKRITENTAVIVNDGYSILQQQGAGTRNGWQNLSVALKWQAHVNAEHEVIVSLGVIRECARTGSASLGNDDVGSTTPTLYFGKGLGNLPVAWLRPLAFNKSIENRWTGGASVQYSLPYLQSQVRDLGLPEFFGRLTPLLEVAWSSPASKANSLGTQVLFGVGVVYTATAYAIGVEALIPGNRQTGTSVGFLAQLHLYLDDLLPNTLGKPLIDW
ncbi:MAG TPA: hypothetical protein VLI93_04145 [Acetobacteraceae bacterium]|nr:hypothetical protein [Acetobacteraceae bacterium]